MIGRIAEIILAFVGTNIDNLIMTAVFLALAGGGADRRNVCAAQFIGLGILFVISLLGAQAARLLPMGSVRWLGILPVMIGVREWIESRRKESKAEEEDNVLPRLPAQVVLTLSGGMDNVSVYIPMMERSDGMSGIGLAAGIFALMMAALCLLAGRIAALPELKRRLKAHAGRLVPIIYILLGVYILIR